VAVVATCSQSARADVLGVAQGYNLFILGDATQTSTDSEGTVAIGGNATFQSYSVATSVPSHTPNALVVGGNLSFTNGTVNGDLHVGGTTSLSGVTVTGVSDHATPVDFNAAATYLKAESNALAGMTANGTVADHYGVTLTGTSTGTNVFNLTSAQFADANGFGLNIVIPTGSTALINVAGTSISMANFQMTINGSASESNPLINHVLFNFSQATSLNDSNVTFLGSVLAPNAALSFQGGHVDGTLIGASLTGPVETHNYPFTGDLGPPVPEPSSIVLLGVCVAVVGLASRFRMLSRPQAITTPDS
jgi:choice-of-anchor A domain-containing protein